MKFKVGDKAKLKQGDGKWRKGTTVVITAYFKTTWAGFLKGQGYKYLYKATRPRSGRAVCFWAHELDKV